MFDAAIYCDNVKPTTVVMDTDILKAKLIVTQLTDFLNTLITKIRASNT